MCSLSGSSAHGFRFLFADGPGTGRSIGPEPRGPVGAGPHIARSLGLPAAVGGGAQAATERPAQGFSCRQLPPLALPQLLVQGPLKRGPAVRNKDVAVTGSLRGLPVCSCKAPGVARRQEVRRQQGKGTGCSLQEGQTLAVPVVSPSPPPSADRWQSSP